jgi:uncharacterized protein YjeT (DUF2065 family)
MESTTLFLAKVIGIYYLVMGISVILYTRQWQKVMADFEKNHFIALPLFFLSLIIGLLIVNVHNIWEWSLAVIITISGWAALLKGVFYMLAPECWIKGVLRCKCIKSDGYFYFWGAVLTIVGVLLAYNAYFL